MPDVCGTDRHQFSGPVGVLFWSTTRFMRHQIDDSVSSELDE